MQQRFYTRLSAIASCQRQITCFGIRQFVEKKDIILVANHSRRPNICNIKWQTHVSVRMRNAPERLFLVPLAWILGKGILRSSTRIQRDGHFVRICRRRWLDEIWVKDILIVWSLLFGLEARFQAVRLLPFDESGDRQRCSTGSQKNGLDAASGWLFQICQ